MPKATVNTEAIRVDLTTLEGGYVTVKQLAHGQKLHRGDISARISFQDRAQKTRKSMGVDPNGDSERQRTEMELMQATARQYEYARMIVDHNLEDDNGVKLNFNDINTFDILAPQIGEEIDQILDDMNAGKVTKEDFTEQPVLASMSEST